MYKFTCSSLTKTQGRYLGLLVALLIGWSFPLSAQLEITRGQSAQQLIESLFGDGVFVSNLQVFGDTSLAIGSFDGTGSNIGLGSGVILSTGDVAEAENPGNFTASSYKAEEKLNTPGWPALDALVSRPTLDAIVFEFDMVPLCDTISISYVFASEEYEEFVGTNFNDVFAFFISGPGIVGTQNIALIPETNTPVAINNVNHITNSQYYRNNYFGTTHMFDGFTVPLQAVSEVTPCESYHVVIAIADVSDGDWDSAVFLETGGITCKGPLVSIETGSSNQATGGLAVEGCANGVLTFELSEVQDTAKVIRFLVEGTATPGEDYITFADSILILPGDSVGILEVEVLEDNLVEGNEYIDFIVSESTICGFDFADTARLFILDPVVENGVEDVAICSGDSIILGSSANPLLAYDWGPSAGLSDTTIANPIFSQSNTGPLPDTLTFTLQTSTFGGFCTVSEEVQAIVYPERPAELVADSVCNGIPTSFSLAPLDVGYVDAIWDFGDGNKANGFTQAYLYDSAGVFQVEMIAVSPVGCNDTLSQAIIVYEKPSIEVISDSVCLGNSNLFFPVLNGGAPTTTPGLEWVWDFGDGTLSDQASPIHTYGEAGTYQVSVQVSSVESCTDSSTVVTEVFALPEATINLADHCQGDEAPIQNLSTSVSGAAVTYLWEMGDGSTLTSDDPAYTYDSPGNYQVFLLATDENNCSDTVSAAINVLAAPVAAFTVEDICQSDNLLLVSESTVAAPSTISNTRWIVSDGNELSGPQNEYALNEPGTYEIQLITTSETQCADTSIQRIDVFPKPVAAFTLTSVCALDEALLENLSSIRQDLFGDQIVSWDWDLGDGSRDGRWSPTYSYSEGGFYPVTLTLTSDKGCTDSLSQELEIYRIPPPPVGVSDTVCFSHRALLAATPTDREIGDIIYWYDRPTAGSPLLRGEQFQTNNLAFRESYYIETISQYGCVSDRVGVEAVVVPPQIAWITASDSVLEVPTAIVTLFVGGNLDGLDYEWDFGDGIQSTAIMPVHEYQFPGRYTVILKTTDAVGCEYELSKTIEVKKIVTLFVPSAFSPNNDGHNDEFFIKERLLNQFRIQVYNRWGQMVYEANNQRFAWDGTGLDGEPVAEGVYTYVINALDVLGDLVEESGTITVLR
ncbi:MAG: choice-of-anchor L domain-containing protein [Bacteroidota bacterium]